MGLGTHPFEHGVIDLGAGNWAWLQPDGGWGWSNAGLIVDGEEAMLVDTLFDLSLTRAMLDGFADAVPGTRISTLVNTHSNGHLFTITDDECRIGAGYLNFPFSLSLPYALHRFSCCLHITINATLAARPPVSTQRVLDRPIAHA